MPLQTKRKLGVFVFTIGVLVGLVFNVFVVWANFEASLWNQTPNQEAPLDGLRCPLVITRAETASITISYRNPLDRPINPVIRTFISERLISLERQESIRPTIAPGETAYISYPVSGEEAVWNRFILVRVNTLPQFTLPARSGSCGILVVNFPALRGGGILFLIVLVSLGGMGGGLWFWQKYHAPLQGRVRTAYQAMLFLSAAILIGMVLEFLAVWGLATLILILTLILLAAVLAYFLASL